MRRELLRAYLAAMVADGQFTGLGINIPAIAAKATTVFASDLPPVLSDIVKNLLARGAETVAARVPEVAARASAFIGDEVERLSQKIRKEGVASVIRNAWRGVTAAYERGREETAKRRG